MRTDLQGAGRVIRILAEPTNKNGNTTFRTVADKESTRRNVPQCTTDVSVNADLVIAGGLNAAVFGG